MSLEQSPQVPEFLQGLEGKLSGVLFSKMIESLDLPVTESVWVSVYPQIPEDKKRGFDESRIPLRIPGESLEQYDKRARESIEGLKTDVQAYLKRREIPYVSAAIADWVDVNLTHSQIVALAQEPYVERITFQKMEKSS